MNLRDLEYLVAVADQGHFGRAAEACNISQPTLSMQIKKLETNLNVQVFERGNKSVRVTRIGELILIHARAALREAKEIRRIARSHQDPWSTELTLGIFPTLAPYLLPRIVPEIMKTYPNLKLRLVEDRTPNLIERLSNGDLDMAILALPVAGDHLMSKKLFTENFELAVPNKDPLASRTSVSQLDLANRSVMLLEDGHCLRDQALEICTLVGGRENQEFRGTSLETLRQMVSAGMGVTIMPELAVQPTSGITYVPFADNPAPSRTIGLTWRKDSGEDVRAEKIGGIIAAEAE
ncbi:LysR substrate-binding domain-containing protein [Govanella unica]|uniref:LysR substrate-binding domain-containing protein n=1 Tax=Govanella unica TaxID=2975056 RepID=A0A9X3TX12_9PROT|nr:LysR substrate-binding domain-containing protein [Govania unica]MDA5193289.1 LysR substrate-binding domain-containing protein [Govania unica]